MGRSVSNPSNASQVAFASFDGDKYEWDDCMDDLRAVAVGRMPSLSRCDEWIGREDHAILENDHAYIGVSEYCGLVAVWVAPKEQRYSDPSPLALHWCDQIKLQPLAECFGVTLRKQGTFSNGEAFFQPADGKRRGDMGLGFSSKEGWL